MGPDLTAQKREIWSAWNCIPLAIDLYSENGQWEIGEGLRCCWKQCEHPNVGIDICNFRAHSIGHGGGAACIPWKLVFFRKLIYCMNMSTSGWQYSKLLVPWCPDNSNLGECLKGKKIQVLFIPKVPPSSSLKNSHKLVHALVLVR